MNRYTVPAHLDDPELIGFWTLDEFLAMIIPFAWGILSQHIFIGLISSVLAWWGLRKLKAGRAVSWIIHSAYWYQQEFQTVSQAKQPKTKYRSKQC